MGNRRGRSGRRKRGLSRPAIKQQYYTTVDQTETLLGSLVRRPTERQRRIHCAPYGDASGANGKCAARDGALLDPQLPLSQVQTMEHAISDSEAPRRFNTALIASFAAIAVLLAVLGIYSVIAFSVALRVQEMAIRMALGSQRSGIVRLVVISGAKLAAVGCVIGLAGAFAARIYCAHFSLGSAGPIRWC